jgi:hypothetical protein
LAPLRDPSSVALDDQIVTSGELPPFDRWAQFRREFDWKQGQHVTLVGPTEAGKTSLALDILPERDFVVVLATKREDDSLYPRLRREGFVMQDELDLDHKKTPKIIFRPPLRTPDTKGLLEQSERFSECLLEIYEVGHWSLYCDEVRYLTEKLKLTSEMDTLWLQGRSLGISIMCATQRPVSIPVNAFAMASHIFSWEMYRHDDINRVAEYAGARYNEVRYALPRIPEHETLYINTRRSELVRTNIRT